MQKHGAIHALTCCAILLLLGPVRCLRLNSLRDRGSYSQKVAAASTRLNYVGTKENVATSGGDDIDRQFPSYSKSLKNGKTPTPLKVGVLLLNLGGPETMEDVEGFLYNLFADPDIIRLPALLSFLQKPIAYVIAKRRAPKSSAAYLSIGGGSPIVKYTSAQAEMIEQSIRKKGLKGAKCYFAMRYWNPYTEEVLNQMHKDGINSIVILPLYPQYSISTSGSSLKLLLDIFENEPEKWGPDKVTHSVVPAWYYRPAYTKTMASMIVEQLKTFSPAEMTTGLHVLFSAHGVPESYIEAGDPYLRHTEECVRLISKDVADQLCNDLTRPASMSKALGLQLAGSLLGTRTGVEVGARAEAGSGTGAGSNTAAPAVQFHLSFQSRVGPVQWLKPYTEETLIELGASGVKNLVVVPVSFVSEHIETLEEIDMEYRELAESNGIEQWRRVPALNTDERFIDDMADIVMEALESPIVTLSEAFLAQMSEIPHVAVQGLNLGADATSRIRRGVVRKDLMPVRVSAEAEKLNGRLAMMGIVLTTLLELFVFHPMAQVIHHGI